MWAGTVEGEGSASDTDSDWRNLFVGVFHPRSQESLCLQITQWLTGGFSPRSFHSQSRGRQVVDKGHQILSTWCAKFCPPPPGSGDTLDHGYRKWNPNVKQEGVFHCLGADREYTSTYFHMFSQIRPPKNKKFLMVREDKTSLNWRSYRHDPSHFRKKAKL